MTFGARFVNGGIQIMPAEVPVLFVDGPSSLAVRAVPESLPDPLHVLAAGDRYPHRWRTDIYHRGRVAGTMSIYVRDGFEFQDSPLMDAVVRAVLVVHARLGMAGIESGDNWESWRMVLAELERQTPGPFPGPGFTGGVRVDTNGIDEIWLEANFGTVAERAATLRVDIEAQARAERQATRRAEQERRERLTRTGDIIDDIDSVLVAAHRENNPADDLGDPWDVENFAPVDSDGGSDGDDAWPFASF